MTFGSILPYVGIVTPVIIALAGQVETFFKDDTPLWKKRLILLFAALTLTAGGYSLYSTSAKKKSLEPWEATQAAYGRAVDALDLANEAKATEDSTKLEKLIVETKALAVDTDKGRAPAWFKARLDAFVISMHLWAITVKFPGTSPAEIVEAYINEYRPTSPYKGKPAEFLSTVGIFRAQDFGPPHWVLAKYTPKGDLQLGPGRLTKEFLFERARELFVDLKGMTQ